MAEVKSEVGAGEKGEKVASHVTNPRSKLLLKNRIKSDVPKSQRGVVYVGRLPHDFYEPDIHKIFAQFGDVTRVRLARRKKDAHSKGYAWVEFDCMEVAQVVADTMNKYMIQSHIIQCEFISADRVQPGLFKNCNSRMRNFAEARRSKAVADHNKPGESDRQKRRRPEQVSGVKAKLAAKGIDYDLEFDEEPPQKRARLDASPKTKPLSPKIAVTKSEKPIEKKKAAVPKAQPKAKAAASKPKIAPKKTETPTDKKKAALPKARPKAKAAASKGKPAVSGKAIAKAKAKPAQTKTAKAPAKK
jgi:nucleolar protein 15